MRILLFANHGLGGDVLAMLVERGHEVRLVTDTAENSCARLADLKGVSALVKPARIPLIGEDVAADYDMIITAHSFRILPGWLLARARLAAIGYHPSLLPAYKGRHAIRDALNDGVSFTGGSVYHLTRDVDGGAVVKAHGVALQRRVQAFWGETPKQIWDRALRPIGVELLSEAVAGYERACV